MKLRCVRGGGIKVLDLRAIYQIAGLSDINLRDNSNWVAIIGSRDPSDDERETAYIIGRKCAKDGKIVVSGAAKGIDRAGHEGCMDGGGITIALVSTPIFMPIYPKENHDLAERIKKQGCVIHPYKTRPIYSQTGISQSQRRLIERSILNAYLCPNIVVVKNSKSPVTGGTKWATYYGMKIGRRVYRVDCNKGWHENPAVEMCSLRWIRELDFEMLQ